MRRTAARAASWRVGLERRRGRRGNAAGHSQGPAREAGTLWRYELSDGSTGLRLRVTPAGRKVWRWHYRPAPGAPQKSRDARLLHARGRPGAPGPRRSAEQAGRAPGRAARAPARKGARRRPEAPGTVKELAERFLQTGDPPAPQSSRGRARRPRSRHPPRLGGRKLSAFSTAACRSAVEAVIERGATTYVAASSRCSSS
jgi:hypothetical protein